MASNSDEPSIPDKQPAPGSRWVLLAQGVVLGFVLGSLMWLITGMQGGGRAWIYLALTTAMIGGGVSAVFGASAARKRGERVTPRIRRR